MDLYDDIPGGASGATKQTSAWAQRQAGVLAARKTASTSSAGPTLSVRPSLPRPIVGTGTSTTTVKKSVSIASTPLESGFQDQEVTDPYDPSRPNDYMAYCRWRIDKKKQEERNKEMQEILAEQELERKQREEDRAASVKRLMEERSGEARDRPPSNASLPPPAPMGRGRGGRGLSNLPAWLTKMQPGPGQDSASSSTNSLPSPTQAGQFEPMEEVGGAALANKLMGKMGFVEGQGLGKSNQGISRPIMHQSTGAGMGIVHMHADDKKKREAEGPTPMAPPPRKRGLFSNPTRVLLLKNMVGPGEVDAELEGETKEECSKFGPVRKCTIREMPGLSIEETVWTFVAFEKQESAVAAYLDMNGRFFGGRQIAASFFDEAKFDRGEFR